MEGRGCQRLFSPRRARRGRRRAFGQDNRIRGRWTSIGDAFSLSKQTSLVLTRVLIGRDRANRTDKLWIGRRLGNGVIVERVDRVDRMDGRREGGETDGRWWIIDVR